jgi:hypothetical protein
MTLTVKDLTTKAMLVSVSFTQWNETKGDKKANQAVEKETGAGEKAGNYRKRLAAKSAVSPVSNAISNCRDFVKEQTRPWSDAGGYRILPSKNYLYFTTELRKHFAIIENAVSEMVGKYDQMKDDAKAFLVGLYDEDDYPTAQEIKAKYTCKMQVMPIPNVNDFRITQISDEDVDAIRKQIEDEMNVINKNLMRDLWDRLYGVVEKAQVAFADPDMKFHDSKIDNIAETISILRRLNMDDDPKLERMCKVVEARICNLDPQEIRKEPEARKEAATDAKKLLDAMSSYL